MLLTRTNGLGDPGGGGASQVDWWYPPEAYITSAALRESTYRVVMEWNALRNTDYSLFERYNALSDRVKRSAVGSQFAAALSRMRRADNEFLAVFQPQIGLAIKRGYVDASMRPRVTPPTAWIVPPKSQLAALTFLTWPVAIVIIVIFLSLGAILISMNAKAVAGIEAQRDAMRYAANAERMEQGKDPEDAHPTWSGAATQAGQAASEFAKAVPFVALALLGWMLLKRRAA